MAKNPWPKTVNVIFVILVLTKRNSKKIQNSNPSCIFGSPLNKNFWQLLKYLSNRLEIFPVLTRTKHWLTTFGKISSSLMTSSRHNDVTILWKCRKWDSSLTCFTCIFFTQISYGNSIWHITLGMGVNFCYLPRVCILQTSPNLPFLSLFRPRFLYLGIEICYWLEFWGSDRYW